MTAKFTIFLTVCIFSVLQVHADYSAVQIDQQTNGTFFQGDIILPSKQRNGILSSDRWPNGVIPYEHGEAWNQEQLKMIDEAMRAIQASTCIRFVKRTNEKDYIVTRNLGGCFSSVGRAGGSQIVSLLHQEDGSSCFIHKTIVHELLHAVGLWHEQSRYDRDKYISINWDNILKGAKYNFDLKTAQDTKTYDVPYNYLSAMHYGAYAFSSNGEITMQPKDNKYTDIIGNVRYGHELDWEKVRRIYECKGPFTPAVTTAAPTTPPTMCGDTIDYCDSLIQGNRCRTDQSMRRFCRKSCGFCKHGQVQCADQVDYCNQYKKEFCGKAAWMNDSCAKTCGLC